ncbi:MAG: SGNH/GDSL hydrolase family protein [Armatimonadetes bacterium]|nr:SGNH/GDSL hydrolase family protein [Armatimonadota bacterium]
MTSQAQSNQPECSIKDGDRILFYGDSITEQLLYTTYVEVLVRTRRPQLDVEFFTSGVGGDCTWGGWMGDTATRVKRDVAPFEPTRITVMLGMNDGGYVPFDSKIFRLFQESYDLLLNLLTQSAPGARLTLMKESPFDEVGHPDTPFKGYSRVAATFGEYVAELAISLGLEYLDLCEPVQSLVEKLAASDPARAGEVVPDAIHPGPSGHLVMAMALAQAWNLAPHVSSLTFDAATGKPCAISNTGISEVEGLSWTQLDRSLPFPWDETFDLAWEHSSFVPTMNLHQLAVRNLKPGAYRLEIDQESIGQFSAEQLSAGLNLSKYPTPMRKQAAEVLRLATLRNRAFHTSQFNVRYWFAENESAGDVLGGLDRLERELNAKCISACQPVPHRFKLTLLTG